MFFGIESNFGTKRSVLSEGLVYAGSKTVKSIYSKQINPI